MKRDAHLTDITPLHTPKIMKYFCSSIGINYGQLSSLWTWTVGSAVNEIQLILSHG